MSKTSKEFTNDSGVTNLLLPIVVVALTLGLGIYLVASGTVYKPATISEENSSTAPREMQLNDEDKSDFMVNDNQNEISYEGWENYYSEIYDLSIKYPPDWILEEGGINHLGVKDEDNIPCIDAYSKYLKDPTSCVEGEMLAPYIEIYKIENDTGARTNTMSFSVVQYGSVPSEGFDNETQTINIGGKILQQNNFSGYTTPAYNKGFQVSEIKTGDNSVFTSLSVFAAARPSKAEYSELETLKKILYSITY